MTIPSFQRGFLQVRPPWQAARALRPLARPPFWRSTETPTTESSYTHGNKQRPNGGIGAFTPDNFPVCDFLLPNVCAVADSNHGFKMLGVGKAADAGATDAHPPAAG